jgi:hypothetical protein
MASGKETATWNRDDRDLLVTLRTNQENTNTRLASMETAIKDINTGITARLLNLEGNAVSKIEIAGFEDRVRKLEATANQWLGKQSLIASAIGIIAGLVGAYIQAGHL